MEREQKYKDHTIKLTADWRFDVSGPLLERDLSLNGFAEAKLAIDQRLAAAAKQKKAEGAFAAQVLDEAGRTIIVRGVHAGQGHLLGVENGRFVYPVHPVLREKLTRLGELRKQVDDILKEVKPYQMTAQRTYGRTRAEDYDALLQQFSDDLEKSTEKAKAL